MIKKQTNSEIKAVMSPLQEVIPVLNFSVILLPCPVFLNPSTLGLVWVAVELGVAPLCLQQCLGLKSVPLCCDLCVACRNRFVCRPCVWLCQFCPLALYSPCLFCAQKQLGMADKALPALGRGELICATGVSSSHLSGYMGLFSSV